MMFGKPVGQYLAFQKVFLLALALMGLARLGLSLAGMPNSTVVWFSMNAVAWAGTFYYGVAVHTKGFGSYKQLLALVFLQMLLFQGIASLGILFAIFGFSNIFAAPEFSFPGQSQWVHLLAHLTVGVLVASLLSWAVASLVLLVTRKLTARPAVG
jgi:hypothetical protein